MKKEFKQAIEKYGVAEIGVFFKNKVKPSERPLLRRSTECYQVLKDSWDDYTMDIQETFRVILLNRGHRLLGIYDLSRGTMTGTLVDVRMILIAALATGATTLILSHNHPSGNLRSSFADIGLTKKIKEAARMFDIEVVDHLIISREGYRSMAEEGEL